jgi:aminoglycoside phosphotransferase (APT) family kinase protein
MREVFGLTFPPTEVQLHLVAAEIETAGLSCPKVLAAGTVDARPVTITTWVTGDSWEPDQLPPSRAAHRTLGAFLARMHQRQRPGFGTLDGPLKPPSGYVDAAVGSARRTVESGGSDASVQLLSVINSADPASVASSFGLVMPDIAGNQFLFSDRDISAVVDLDSYVIGPIELELTIAEWCLVEHAAFADGYQSVRPLPSFSSFRAFHRATMLVNDEAVAGDIRALLEENAFFD